MTCGVGVKPSFIRSSARTSIMGYYFLSALEAPAPTPLPILVRPTHNSESLRLFERTMRNKNRYAQLGLLPLGVLTNLVSATRNLRSHIATTKASLHLLTSLVLTTVSIRTKSMCLDRRRVVAIRCSLLIPNLLTTHVQERVLPVSGVSRSCGAYYAHA